MFAMYRRVGGEPSSSRHTCGSTLQFGYRPNSVTGAWSQPLSTDVVGGGSEVVSSWLVLAVCGEAALPSSCACAEFEPTAANVEIANRTATADFSIRSLRSLVPRSAAA